MHEQFDFYAKDLLVQVIVITFKDADHEVVTGIHHVIGVFKILQVYPLRHIE